MTPEEGAPELADPERDHALRVLRLDAGQVLLGLDGRGRAWPLRIRTKDRRALTLELDGELIREPEAGQADARLPWIELALPLPRAGRAEELVDRATQLGASAIQWIRPERTPPRSREPGRGRLARLERVAAAATKQSGRLWSPELRAPLELGELLSTVAERVLLDPAAEAPLFSELIAGSAVERWNRAHPLILFAGPEGGFTSPERSAMVSHGARPARLTPTVLRIETAVEAALAIAVHACQR